MSVKCYNCGLMNFPDDTVCRRCQTPIDYNAAPPPPGAWAAPSSGPASSGTIYDGTSPYGAPGYGAPGYGVAPAPYNAPTFGYGYRPAMELAGRGTRLAAVVLDGLAIFVPVFGMLVLAIPLSRAGGAAGILLILVGVVAVLAIAIVNLVMLSSSGQTIGKRMLGIRIVKHDTGENGGFLTNVVMRILVMNVIGMVPLVGPIASLVDVFFIFRADQRCLHDLIAGTSVVRA
jgi:uncharacterized RDD family membrane protein YckC